ncbi:protein CLP1 homolog [Ctenocephalides felis]|uniref:protein CLP1 homolog n=1 Tax=Ctenocephalides felis TaxID=7515 RepID=UPI000E6E28DC|nr:protein CLP1 homolog [Ctenocephalides felis]
MAEAQVKKVQEFKLDPDTELRFEVESKNEHVTLTLKSGFAELFGTELVIGKKYEFKTGAKVAVFSWQGATLELEGKTDVSYIARDTPMVQYLNCHNALEQQRDAAEKKNIRGPICMIVGPMDVGKSTLCRLLLNWAVRCGRRPIMVDLDVGQGNIAIPGTIGALLIERPAPVEEGFCQEAPLVYHFGHKSPSGNYQLYNMAVTRLSEVILERIEANKKSKSSGIVINTCGWVKGEGYKQLTHAAQAFEVDAILVLDQERLFNELVRDMPDFVKVVLLPKSGGVVERSKTTRAETREQRIREYFYGERIPYYPHSFDVKFSEAKIYKIGALDLPDSCVPIGIKIDDSSTKLMPIPPGPALLHHLLAVTFAENPDEEVLQSNIAGYVCVTHVDMERQVFTVLSPQPRPLPQTVLLLSDLQFMDSH